MHNLYSLPVFESNAPSIGYFRNGVAVATAGSHISAPLIIDENSWQCECHLTLSAGGDLISDAIRSRECLGSTVWGSGITSVGNSAAVIAARHLSSALKVHNRQGEVA